MLNGTELPNIGSAQGERTKRLLDKKSRFVAKGISNLAPIFVETAKGAVVRDIDGNEYLDFYGGIGVINGYRYASRCIIQSEKIIRAIKLTNLAFKFHINCRGNNRWPTGNIDTVCHDPYP